MATSRKNTSRRQAKNEGLRLSGYIEPRHQAYFKRTLRRAIELDHLTGKPGIGYLLRLLADFDIPIHRRAMELIKRLLREEAKRSRLLAAVNGDGPKKPVKGAIPPLAKRRRHERAVA
jgi:hypothetical protein